MAGGPETILLQLALLLVGAKLGSEAAQRLKQPPVVGEILVGILLGPSLLGLIPSFDIVGAAEHLLAGEAHDATGDLSPALDLHVLAILAELGVLLLLFEVGLESSLKEFRAVGASAGLVGFLGVAVSLAAGAVGSYVVATRFDWVATPAALAQPHLLHLFIGATLTATSVGITARVLTDMQRIRTRETQIILGAAVFDDVLGLIVLAIVGGLVTNPSAVTPFGVAQVLFIAFGFFVLAIVVGLALAPRLVREAHQRFRTPFAFFVAAFAWMLLVSYVSTLAGLASIVGAFAAGLALSGSEYRHQIFEALRPVASLFVSFFFVVLGLRVDLQSLTADLLPTVAVVVALLTVLGVLAKLACGLGVVGGRASRLVVGVGMVPRGEVGLIFALFGLENGLLQNWQYATIIIVVLITTLVTPFWLKSLGSRFHSLETAPPATAKVKETTG